MKKVLVLVAGYPTLDGNKSQMFVHIRNKLYSENNIQVTVLNFSSKEDYIIDGIEVITFKSFCAVKNKYDIAISHAPNLRNHYFFLKLYGSLFKYFIFFFHGHEVVKINTVYPPAYKCFGNSHGLKYHIQNLYDSFKLFVWKHYFPKVAYKSNFIFVSESFFSEFKEFTGLTENDLCNHNHVINNSADQVFLDSHYNTKTLKKYDFVTIRSNIDSSVYCIDIINKMAMANPNYKFLVIGKGKWFDYNSCPENLCYLNKVLSHEEIIKALDSSRIGLMPTRRDTQGVMSCEMVTYGIPLLTSALPITHEMFDSEKNVLLLKNEDFCKADLKSILNDVSNNYSHKVSQKFSYENTVELEIQLINAN